MVVPFAPSAGWYSVYVKSLLSGLGEEESVAAANRSVSDPKGMARCAIAGNGSSLVLSIPLEGGASRLKRHHSPEAIRLSEHGRWRDVHRGAISAAYGKTPCYPHLAGLLEDVYTDAAVDTLAGFNLALFQGINCFLGLPEILDDISRMKKERENLLTEIISETKTKVDSDVSILDAIFRLGKDTVFGLL